MKDAIESRAASLLPVLVVAAAYLYASPHYPRLANPNENVRVQMTAALVDDHTYRIDGVRARWGFSNDAACVDTEASGRRTPCETPAPRPGVARHYYSVKAPLGSLLGVPAFAIARAVRGASLDLASATLACRLGGTILPCLALLYATRRFLAHDLAASPFAKELAFYAIALGSVLYGYGLLFVSHTPSALFAFVAFARLERARRRGSIHPADAAFAGFLTAGTTALEYPAVFVSAALSIYAVVALRSLRGVVAFGAGALVPVLAVMHFQHAAFGSPFRPGHLFVENPAFRVYHQQGFFGAETLHLDAAARLLVDPRLGLLTTTPFVLLAPLGVVALRDDAARRVAARLALGSSLALYVPVTFLSNWDGGWVIGPRYLVTVVPFVVWLAAHGAVAMARFGKAGEGMAFGLSIASLITAALPSVYYPHLPPEIRAPFADAYLPLLQAGLVPPNVGQALGLRGLGSMAPLFALVGAVALAPLRHLGRHRALLWAVPVAFVAAAPSFAVSDVPHAVERAQRFIASTFEPEP